jgi:hypothetical protein
MRSFLCAVSFAFAFLAVEAQAQEQREYTIRNVPRCTSNLPPGMADPCRDGVITYQTLARAPESFVNSTVNGRGKVIQIMENGDDITLRVDTTRGPQGLTTSDTIYMEYHRELISEPHILVNDVVAYSGKFMGLKSYRTVRGDTLQLPYVVARTLASVPPLPGRTADRP